MKSEKVKIRFIINPISGGICKTKINSQITNLFETDKYYLDFQFTQFRNHATELAKQSVEEAFDIVAAVGGDGTVNEVSKSLINSNVEFAIIPMGSGNGLSRFLNIPLNLNHSIEIIRKRKTFKMDIIRIDREYFVNMAGIGFDALISHLFSNYGKRGFISYLRLIIREFFRYQNENYQLIIDGNKYDLNAFLVSFANSSQFGNGAHIAPLAEINDGLMDVCIIKEFPKWKSIFLAYLLFTKKLLNSRYYELIKTSELTICNRKSLKAHIDGDPVIFDSDIELKILPEALKVIIP